MKFRKILIATIFAAASAAAQGSVSSLTNDQIKYFASFFALLGDPNMKETFPSHREISVRSIFGMNQADASALRSAVSTYTGQMTQLFASERAIVFGKSALTDSDRAEIAQLVDARNQMVASIATTLLGSLRSETSAGLLADAQNIANIRNRKGAK